MWQEKKRCVCQLCGPTACKLCFNCRGKHSWWKAISQIILATIRKCGGVKWRFHMQMCQWERSGTLPNSSDPHSPALVCFIWDREAQRDRLTLPWRRWNTGFNQASIIGNPNNNKMPLLLQQIITTDTRTSAPPSTRFSLLTWLMTR